jgi:DNA topoisomerase-1
VGGQQKKPDRPLEEKCPQCGSNLVVKSGRFGEFTACGNYPTCKYVKQKTIGVKCPECAEGEVVERRSKRGRTFYGCHRYPDCKFVAWGKPVAEKCPKCGSPYLVEKWLKAGGFWQCPNAACKYKQPAPEPVEALAR